MEQVRFGLRILLWVGIDMYQRYLRYLSGQIHPAFGYRDWKGHQSEGDYSWVCTGSEGMAVDVDMYVCYRAPINSLLVIDENMMASGDDQGVIKASHPCHILNRMANDDIDLGQQKRKTSTNLLGAWGFHCRHDVQQKPSHFGCCWRWWIFVNLGYP